MIDLYETLLRYALRCSRTVSLNTVWSASQPCLVLYSYKQPFKLDKENKL